MAGFDAEALVSAAELGLVLGVSDRWVRDLTKQGVLSKSGRGRYRLGESVRAHLAHRLETEVGGAVRKIDAKQDYERERARKLKLQNDREEGLLVPIEDASAALDQIVGVINSDLAGVPARITDDVAERRRIEGALDAVMHGLSERLTQAGGALREGGDPAKTLDAAAA